MSDKLISGRRAQQEHHPQLAKNEVEDTKVEALDRGDGALKLQGEHWRAALDTAYTPSYFSTPL